MELMGLDEEEPDPPHGFYARVEGTNVINGFAHEYAGDRINKFFANQMTDQEFAELFQAFEAEALRKGFTSIQDMSVGLGHSKTLDLLRLADLSIRWRAICYPFTLDEGCDERPHFSPNDPFDRIQGSGIKWITDGTPIERLAHVTTEYLDQPGWFGESSFSPAQFDTIMTRALAGSRQKSQTLLHIAGDANWDQMLASMSAHAPDAVWRQRRMRVEHGDLLRPDLYAQARNKGIVVVQNPSHFGIPDIFSARFAPEVYAYSMPWKSLRDAGIHIAIGTDGIGEVGDPYLDLFLSLIHPIRPEEQLSVEDTVTAYTQGSAYAEFQENSKGTLEPGKLGDIAVLSQDIFTVAPPDILNTESVLTIVGGQIAYDNR
jgi:predicted amidohydrolase YtcJ